ncbi:MAG: hypothetical protein H6581_19750 [Bacteroidia bacterium]|nr:hypothetical protein [Bacteroidia bacterium]
MENKSLPAVVIPAFERPHCLARLLRSVAAASYPAAEVTLVFSLEGGADPEVVRLAEEFEWNHGPKRILQRKEKLGLRRHILACGDLSQVYGSIVLIEDDLLVAPGFYQFACAALDFYQNDESISGISLYTYAVSECRFLPFRSLEDENEVYFQQFASSWGQAWSLAQWKGFRAWYQENEEIKAGEALPQYLREWSETSWKRHFIRYLLACDKYFVFPKTSFSTNFGDPGTNSDTPGLFQVPLTNKSDGFHFVPLQDSRAVYDVYFELKPDCLKALNPALQAYDLTVDLYGQRDPDFLQKEFVLSSRHGANPVLTFGLEMVPLAENVIRGVEGREIGLYKTEDLDLSPRPLHHYFYQYRSNMEFMFRDFIEKRGNELAEIWAEERSEYKAIEKAYPIAEKMAEEKAQVLAEPLAEARAAARFADWKENLEFGQKWPKISLILPFEGEGDWFQKVLSLDYPHLEIICLTAKESLEKVLDEKQRRVIRWVNCAEKDAWLRLKSGLQLATGELVGWLPPGICFTNGGLKSVAAIVRKFPEISWIMGRNQIDKRSHVFRRWTRERFLAAQAERLGDFRQPATMLWKAELMQKVLEQQEVNGLYDLFAGFFQFDFQYVISPTLGEKWRQAEKAYFGNKGVSKGGISFGKRLWNKLTYPFFLMDMKVLRTLFTEANQVPDVILMDRKGEFYRSKF